MSSIKFTVLFDTPFWVGIAEREYEGTYSVARTVFGAEPRDFEVFHFIIHNYDSLRFSDANPLELKVKEVNPKRLQREIRKEVEKSGVMSKAQDALRIEQEKNKKEKRANNRLRREELKQERFELRQEKKKEKKRGH